MYTHTHTHTHTYVCVCVYINSICVNKIVEIVLSILCRVWYPHVLVGIIVDLDKIGVPVLTVVLLINVYILCIFVCICNCIKA